jgi:lipoprotein NlpD
VLALLAGCSGPGYYEDVPEPREPEPVQEPPAPGGRVVKAGDTLYSIAFSTGLDWRELAAINGIAPPYTIYPGQRLRLGTGAVESTADAEPEMAPVGAQARPAQGGTALPLPAPGPAALPLPGPAVQTPPARPAEPPPAVVSRPPASSAPPPVASAPKPAPRALKPGAWQWPAQGRLMRGFAAGAQPHKGVDIAGAIGDPVHAANNGTVVYAGSGVRGYGNLLILKHDAQYLSAYAHNSRLLVKEGDVVSGGQRIAEIGDSGTDRVKLHFEVRRQGSPVDPLKVLPKR